jgi:hypothetical protein
MGFVRETIPGMWDVFHYPRGHVSRHEDENAAKAAYEAIR